MHACGCVAMLTFISWSLLSPDPFAIVRHNQLSWISRLDDLILHLSAFSVLSISVCSLCLRWVRTLPVTVVSALGIYAVVTELLQCLVAGRTCDPADAMANAFGILCGMFVTVQVWWLCQASEKASQQNA